MAAELSGGRTAGLRGADACGLNRLYFYEPRSRQAWDYIYPPGEMPWLAGGTLCYWKKILGSQSISRFTSRRG